MKKIIPNILTTYRLIAALLIPVLFFINNYHLLTIILITALLSDAVDGFLARKWNVISNYGKIIDVIADKSLVITTSICFIFINKFFLITLIFESIIGVVSVIGFIKDKNIKNKNFNNKKVLIIGKIKTVFVFITLFIGYISFMCNKMNNLILPFIIISAIFQVMTAISYAKK